MAADDQFFEFKNQLEKRGWVESGGQITLDWRCPPSNLDAPNAYQLLSTWESLEPRSVEWQVNVQMRETPALTAQNFPPRPLSRGAIAGAGSSSAQFWTDFDNVVACKLELGAGPNARTIFTDLRPGRFALGVQTRVRASLARWRHNEVLGGVYDIQSSVSHAASSDADPPTFTACRLIAGGGGATIIQPPGAAWFDLSLGQEGNTTVSIGTMDGTFFKSNAVAAPLCYPPATPWPAPSDEFLTVTNIGTQEVTVTLRWWVR